MREINDKVYRVISWLMLTAHILAFLAALVGSFLPYIGEGNFYVHHTGALGTLFPQIHPYVILLFPAAACVFAVLAVRRPTLTLLPGICLCAFLLCRALPIAGVVLGVAIQDYFTGEITQIPYGVGFHLMTACEYLMYADGVYVLYTLFTLFLRGRKEKGHP